MERTKEIIDGGGKPIILIGKNYTLNKPITSVPSLAQRLVRSGVNVLSIELSGGKPVFTRSLR